jgi:hypothetical protein
MFITNREFEFFFVQLSQTNYLLQAQSVGT